MNNLFIYAFILVFVVKEQSFLEKSINGFEAIKWTTSGKNEAY